MESEVAGLACVDGVLSPLSEARIPLADRSVLQADAVFEVLRTYGGRPHRFEAHLTRLSGSCERVGLSEAAVPPLRDDVERVLDAAGPGEWVLRLWIGARGAPNLSRTDQDTRRAVLATPLTPYATELYEQGVSVVTSAGTSLPRATHGAKTTNYLSAIVATTRARSEHGAHEVVRLGLYGEVLEGGSSNIFAVLPDGALVTPPLGVGILSGITRDTVLRLAREQGLARAREGWLTCHDLYRAREVMLTSSVREVMPVVQVDGVQIGQGVPGPLARSLLRAYRADAGA